MHDLVATKAEESKQFMFSEMDKMYKLREENYRLQTLVELYESQNRLEEFVILSA